MHGKGPYSSLSVSFYFKFPHDARIIMSEAKRCRKFHAVRFLHSFHIRLFSISFVMCLVFVKFLRQDWLFLLQDRWKRYVGVFHENCRYLKTRKSNFVASRHIRPMREPEKLFMLSKHGGHLKLAFVCILSVFYFRIFLLNEIIR